MLHCYRIILALLVALPLMAGCAPARQPTETVQPEESQLTSSDVLLIAKATATEEGMKLDDYNPPNVVFVDSHAKLQWWVHFDGKRGTFGDDFSVFVDDGTRAAEVFLGR
jgi:hypothetical protein